MSESLPLALINGIGRFCAKKLAAKLSESDMRVAGVGEVDEITDEIGKIEIVGSVEDVADKADYVFDFENDEASWEKAKNDRARLTIVGVNKSTGKRMALEEMGVNWRMINLHGVYGRGMGEDGETAWLAGVMRMAVANKNLMMPKRGSDLRLLAEADVIEAIMRASFLSGTEGEVFEIWGRRVEVEDLAKLLIDEAKMTRFKVSEGEEVRGMLNEEEVVENWRRLRWRPEVEPGEGMKETLQYYFLRADEESRNKKNITNYPPEADYASLRKYQVTNTKTQTANSKRRYEAEIEPSYDEATTGVEKPITNYELKISNIEPEEEITNEETREEKEEKPITNYPPKADNASQITKEETREEKEELDEIKPIIKINKTEEPTNNYELKITNETKEEKEEKLIVNGKPDYAKATTGKPTDAKAVAGKWLWWGVGLAGMVAIVWFGSGIVRAVQMFGRVAELPKVAAGGNFEEAERLMGKIAEEVRREERLVEGWGLNRWAWGRKYQQVLKVVEEGVEIGGEAVDLTETADEINAGMFEDKEIDWGKNMSGLKEGLAEIEGGLGILSARLSGDWSWVPARWRGRLNELKQDLASIRDKVTLGRKAAEILPEFLGLDGKRREYMVLLQNENELRPGGGFIGSWAILSFEGGKLLNFEIKDIYEADGQLKGHVEPPEPIRDYLGEAGWFMRDANWQADFTGASKDIQWFLEKETGRKVDGVIGVNLAVAKGILSVTGEVYVPDFKEKVNANNLYEQAEFYSETKFFPGSNQKESFLGGVGQQLFEKVKELEASKRFELMGELINLMQKNEIQMAMNNKQAAGVIAELGWNGAIYEGRCAEEGGRCFADYLYVVEANLGVNKANYFLYRNIDETVEISERSIARVVKISYENTAKSSNWPGGDYKNYLRVYIPATANVAEVSVAENEEGRGKTIINGDKLKVATVRNKKELGMLVTVPIGARRIVEIRYADQVDLTKTDKFSYLSFIQKQSGFGDTGLVTLVAMPNEWQAVQVEPAATLVGGKLLFNQKLTGNIRMGVEIEK